VSTDPAGELGPDEDDAGLLESAELEDWLSGAEDVDCSALDVVAAGAEVLLAADVAPPPDELLQAAHSASAAVPIPSPSNAVVPKFRVTFVPLCRTHQVLLDQPLPTSYPRPRCS
jgi:hypothetical protein